MKNDLSFDPKVLAEALRRSRELVGKSFRQLAADSGVSTSQILRIESGEFDCYVSSMVRLCGALGIRFGEILERCVLPEYALYQDALKDELKNNFPANFPQSDESKEACKDLVFGGCLVLIHLLRTANVQKTFEEMTFPSSDICDRFGKIASSLQFHPPTLSVRNIFFEKLQRAPLATLIGFYKFPTVDHIEGHIVRMADSKKRNKGFYPGWFPILRTYGLNYAEENDVFYIAPEEKLRRPVKPAKLSSKELLDIRLSVLDSDGVKTECRSLSDLMDAIRDRTKLRGQKVALANKMNVSRQAVDQWLSGRAKPSAETTLELLEWVKGSKSVKNKNALAVRQTPPELRPKI